MSTYCAFALFSCSNSWARDFRTRARFAYFELSVSTQMRYVRPDTFEDGKCFSLVLDASVAQPSVPTSTTEAADCTPKVKMSWGTLPSKIWKSETRRPETWWP